MSKCEFKVGQWVKTSGSAVFQVTSMYRDAKGRRRLVGVYRRNLYEPLEENCSLTAAPISVNQLTKKPKRVKLYKPHRGPKELCTCGAYIRTIEGRCPRKTHRRNEEIRDWYEEKKFSQYKIAKMFNVSKQYIHQIVQRFKRKP